MQIIQQTRWEGCDTLGRKLASYSAVVLEGEEEA